MSETKKGARHPAEEKGFVQTFMSSERKDKPFSGRDTMKKKFSNPSGKSTTSATLWLDHTTACSPAMLFTMGVLLHMRDIPDNNVNHIHFVINRL